ncbi:MAG TPA: hypothetical protein VGF45_24190 [Polyangia bacterium]
MKIFGKVALVGFLGVLAAGCGGSGTEAERRGIGAACSRNENCLEGLTCLSFKGGYCGLVGCTSDANCPAGSACVHHENTANYCFLVCNDKPECNRFRPVENEANCAANVTFVQPKTAKACVPPSRN